MESISEERICSGCQREILEPLEGDSEHQTQMTKEEMDALLKREGYTTRMIWNPKLDRFRDVEWEN